MQQKNAVFLFNNYSKFFHNFLIKEDQHKNFCYDELNFGNRQTLLIYYSVDSKVN